MRGQNGNSRTGEKEKGVDFLYLWGGLCGSVGRTRQGNSVGREATNVLRRWSGA